MSKRESCPAPKLLRKWLTTNDRSQAWFAKKMMVSAPSVHAWLEEVSRPVPHLRDLIELLTDGAVPAPAWEMPSETQHKEKARRRILGIEKEGDAA